MRLPPKMTPAQIAETQRMAREWKRLGAPGKSAMSARWTNVRLQEKGLLLGLRSPLALLMKLRVCAGPACPRCPNRRSSPKLREFYPPRFGV
jgi:hypothetical protein